MSPFRPAPNESRRNVPALQLVLAGVLALLALLALGLDLAGACGSCARGTDFHALIAAMGSVGYLALLGFGLWGRSYLFHRGVFAAGGIHLALLLWMAQRGSFCALCVTTAAVAFVLVGVCLRAAEAPTAFLGRVFVPASLAAGALAAWAQAAEESRLLEKSRALLGAKAGPPLHDPLSEKKASLVVYEIDHCGYCRDFRSFYLPRLRKEFGSRLEVRFLAAESTSWVNRTPTFVLEGKLAFEGLPLRYEDLRVAVARSLAVREN